MKLLKRLLTAAILPFAIALPAEARIYRTPDSARVFVTNLAPQQRISLTYNGLPSLRDLRSNVCGQLFNVANSQSTSLQVSGRIINLQTLPVHPFANCTDGVAEPRPPIYRSPEGYVAMSGLPPNTAISTVVGTNRSRSATANSCGIATFSSTATFNHVGAAITYQAGRLSNLAIDRLPLRDMPLCQRGQLYFPTSWLGQRYP